MKRQEILSPKNEQFKNIVKLRQKKYRQQSQYFLIEGFRFVKHALELNAGVSQVILCESLLTAEEISAIDQLVGPMPVMIVPMNLCKELTDTVSPQGAFAVVKMPVEQSTLKPEGRYLALDRLQDPGNLGTIIRTADAAGFDGVIMNKGTVDPYSEKVLRSTMGSIFSVPLIWTESFEDYLTEAKQQGFKVYATALENSVVYTEAPLASGCIVVIGNEAQGISEAVFELSDLRITIPLAGGAESLNAAVAAAVVMFESQRQRNLDL